MFKLKNTKLGKTIAAGLLTLIMSLLGPQDAFCSFSVDWGVSWDDGQMGDQHIAQWLVNNGYYNNLNDAGNFARTGYIGYNNSDADPFYWNLNKPLTLQIEQEIAGYADLNILGYYSGKGDSKILTQIFGGTENGPTTLMINQPFGFYLNTPEQNFWFTDRGENTDQFGLTKNNGGDPQGLIYELKPNKEWLLAWEDLDATGWTDNDYNDMYMRVTVVPEPVSSVLYLLGCGAMAMGWRRRRS